MSERQRNLKSPAHPKSPGAPTTGPARLALVFGLGVLLVGALILALRQSAPPPSAGGSPPATDAAPATASATNAPAPQAADSPEHRARAILGRWLRPDGGYILEIRAVLPDDRLDAAYFNPAPIHVGRAEWRQAGGKLRVFVELQDVNYPGSLYTLAYSPENDLLSGTYFQALQRQTFDVEFVRQK